MINKMRANLTLALVSLLNPLISIGFFNRPKIIQCSRFSWPWRVSHGINSSIWVYHNDLQEWNFVLLILKLRFESLGKDLSPLPTSRWQGGKKGSLRPLRLCDENLIWTRMISNDDRLYTVNIWWTNHRRHPADKECPLKEQCFVKENIFCDQHLRQEEENGETLA